MDGDAKNAQKARGALEVSAFAPSQVSPVTASRAGVALASAIASVLLHGALVMSAVWEGDYKYPPSHPAAGLGTSKLPRVDEIGLEWVSIDESSLADSGSNLTLALLPPQLVPIATALAKIPQLAIAIPDQDRDVTGTSGESDSESTHRLQGQYMGQINARIDRVWVRPRSAIGEDRFLCYVRIAQDAGGNVTEVTLEQCNGTVRWQLSLVRAIESASPLPAPPDSSVFAHVIHLRFEAVPIELAVSREQYERASAAN
jgi:hypothetical protein